MKKAAMSNSKHNCHSKKDCICGSHSANSRKHNLNHNSTRQRYLVSMTRRALGKMDIV